MFLIFGLLLLWTAVRLYRHRDEDPDVGHNPLVRASRRILPVTDIYDGGRLISRSGGRRVVTPLFIVFITIGGTDILFALDSIPAVFGVTDQPYIVFAANAFALLGLRALFFLAAGLLDRLVYLSAGLALILAFIGVKLILHWGHGLDHRVPEITTAVSLAVIGVVLAVTTWCPARPRTLPLWVSITSQQSRARNTAVTAAAPFGLKISGRGDVHRAVKTGHTVIVAAPSAVQARCCGVEPATGWGDPAILIEASPATISRTRAGTRTPARPTAVTRWPPPTRNRTPVMTHRSVPGGWPARSPSPGPGYRRPAEAHPRPAIPR
jgi:predicted tellurium resistance membrane protein TerC